MLVSNEVLKRRHSTNEALAPYLDLLSQDKGSSLTSKTRYKPISTLQVVDAFLSRGFTVKSVNRSFGRKEENKGYEKHQVVLRAPNSFNFKIEGLVPTLTIKNSYDAGQSLSFYLGVYRLVCSNGLVVGSGLFYERIRHVGDVNGKLAEALNRSKTAYDLVANSINEWQNFTLTGEQKIELTQRLIHLRLPKTDEKTRIIVPTRSIQLAMRARRPEDQSNDLFTFYNRLQENLVQRPDFRYIRQDLETHETRNMSLRKLNAIAGTEANSKLWQATADFYKEVA